MTNSDQSISIPMFGARKAANKLSEELLQLRTQHAAALTRLEELGALTLDQLEERKELLETEIASQQARLDQGKADAAQSIFNKRLMPLAKNQTFFTADELKKAIENLDNEEVFKSGLGCVSIENPVRRTDGRMIPIDEIKKISEYCRSKNIKLHLDGARIYMASAWSGISIKEYASYFDTIYISLYKYLGASGGAILCGDKTLIEKMPHMIKIHGGNMFGNWLNAAMIILKGVINQKRSANL